MVAEKASDGRVLSLIRQMPAGGRGFTTPSYPIERKICLTGGIIQMVVDKHEFFGASKTDD